MARPPWHRPQPVRARLPDVTALAPRVSRRLHRSVHERDKQTDRSEQRRQEQLQREDREEKDRSGKLQRDKDDQEGRREREGDPDTAASDAVGLASQPV